MCYQVSFQGICFTHPKNKLQYLNTFLTYLMTESPTVFSTFTFKSYLKKNLALKHFSFMILATAYSGFRNAVLCCSECREKQFYSPRQQLLHLTKTH